MLAWLLFALALRGAHQDEGLVAVRSLVALGLHAFAHGVPIACIEQLAGKALELPQLRDRLLNHLAPTPQLG
jgi:hypothetical protein